MVLKRIEIIVLITAFLICMGGIANIFQIVKSNSSIYIKTQNALFLQGTQFPAAALWFFVAISFALSCIDAFASTSKMEIQLNKRGKQDPHKIVL